MIEYYLDIENDTRRILCRECIPRIGETLFDHYQKYKVLDVQHNIDQRVESRELGLPVVIATPIKSVTKDKN